MPQNWASRYWSAFVKNSIDRDDILIGVSFVIHIILSHPNHSKDQR